MEGQAATLDVALSGTAEPQADVSDGGCTIGKGDVLADPMLWLLMLLAAGVLWRAPLPPLDVRARRSTTREREHR